jgi:hypothetical protein
MIQINCQCDRCERVVRANIGQAFDFQLRWSLSYECPYCHSTVEMDDVGFPPQEIRKSIIAQEGEWKLIIDKASLNDKIKTLKVLRKAFSYSIQETSKLVKNFPYITSGTKTEMNWLKRLLSNENIKSLVKKKDTN